MFSVEYYTVFEILDFDILKIFYLPLQILVLNPFIKNLYCDFRTKYFFKNYLIRSIFDFDDGTLSVNSFITKNFRYLI